MVGEPVVDELRRGAGADGVGAEADDHADGAVQVAAGCAVRPVAGGLDAGHGGAAAGVRDGVGDDVEGLADVDGGRLGAPCRGRSIRGGGPGRPAGTPSWRPGWEAEAEAACWEAAEADHPDALVALAWLLRRDEAEAAYREAAAASRYALVAPAGLLRWTAGREAEAEAAYREAAAAGHPDALRHLAEWLSGQEGREAEAEAAYREAAAAGDPRALVVLAGLLRWTAGREAEAEAMYREAAAAGERTAVVHLRELLEAAGRSADADLIRRHGLDARGGTAGRPDG